MNRDQRIWDTIYASAWVALVVRHDGDPSDEQLARFAITAFTIADRGLAELGLQNCQECDGNGSTWTEQICTRCAGTGRVVTS